MASLLWLVLITETKETNGIWNRGNVSDATIAGDYNGRPRFFRSLKSEYGGGRSLIDSVGFGLSRGRQIFLFGDTTSPSRFVRRAQA